MINVKNKILQFLPENTKRTIRPIHRKIKQTFSRPPIAGPSRIGIGVYGGFQIAYRKGTTDENVLAESFDRDTLFSGVPEYQAADSHVIIDVGAHIGTFSLLAAHKVQNGKVYAVEACEESFNLLRINLALNNAANVDAQHLAITDRQGTCRLYYDTGNWGHSVVSPISRRGEDVNCCTLEDFLQANKIDKCHFIKLNCEGAEFPILLSTPSDVLQRFDTLLVLYHCDLWDKHTDTDLVSHFESSAFSVVVRNRSQKRGWIIATKRTGIAK
jgi:FkbM family methyltransferase